MALSGTGAGGREWRQHPALATAKSASTRSIHNEDFAGVSPNGHPSGQWDEGDSVKGTTGGSFQFTHGGADSFLRPV